MYGSWGGFFAVCLHPLLGLVLVSILLWIRVRISSSEVEARQAAPAGGEGSKRGNCLMSFCMSRRNARGQELVPSQEWKCQGRGSGEQLWLLWSLTWMIRCWYVFAVGQQKCSAPKPKGAWALPALVMFLLVNSQVPVQEHPFRQVQQRSPIPQGTIQGVCLLAEGPSNEGPEKSRIREIRNNSVPSHLPATDNLPHWRRWQAIFNSLPCSCGAPHSWKPFLVVYLPRFPDMV